MMTPYILEENPFDTCWMNHMACSFTHIWCKTSSGFLYMLRLWLSAVFPRCVALRNSDSSMWQNVGIA